MKDGSLKKSHKVVLKRCKSNDDDVVPIEKETASSSSGGASLQGSDRGRDSW